MNTDSAPKLSGVSATPTDRSTKSRTEACTCRVCGSSREHPVFRAEEMMFGTRETFDYFQCVECGCLQIRVVPDDLPRFYGDAYYSFNEDHAARYRSSFKNFLNLVRDRVFIFFPYGEKMPFPVAVPSIQAIYRAIRKIDGLTLNSRILDVGCGSGQVLYRLHNAGFKHLFGIDPFLNSDTAVSERLSIFKRSLSEDRGQYDLLMMNHSFEHVSDPLEMLVAARDRLTQTGVAMIRIPIADSFAWEHYGVNWFQLDAPRHLFLHTRESMRRLALEAGLQIRSCHCDSDQYQFMLSERYARGLPMKPAAEVKEPALNFTEEQEREYIQKAHALNAEGRGDQAVFYLVRR